MIEKVVGGAVLLGAIGMGTKAILWVDDKNLDMDVAEQKEVLYAQSIEQTTQKVQSIYTELDKRDLDRAYRDLIDIKERAAAGQARPSDIRRKQDAERTIRELENE